VDADAAHNVSAAESGRLAVLTFNPNPATWFTGTLRESLRRRVFVSKPPSLLRCGLNVVRSEVHIVL
jgi:hypothetical protein